MEMTRIEFDVPKGILASMRCNADQFTRKLRLFAAVKWYEEGTLSQGRAAEFAGISRAEFIEALGRYGVTPFQVEAEELVREVMDE